MVVNLHLKATGFEDGDTCDKMDLVIQALEQQLEGERDIVLLGDFNTDPDSEGQ